MEPAIIDWKRVESRYVRDEAYENINAPMWLDLNAPDSVPVDDAAWFCRPDCKHPKTAEDFKLSAMASPKAKMMRSSPERLPFGERNSNRRDENKLKRRGGLVAAPLLPTSPLKPKASKAFKEDLENQDPNQSTPSRLPRPTKTRNAAKEMIKSSAGKKVEEEREEPKPEKLPPRLKSTMSARNLFSGKDLLSQISEFYHELKRMAVGTKTLVGEEAEKEVDNVAESSQQDSKLLIPNKLKIVIEKSTFPKEVRANPPTPQRFPSPRGVKNAKAIANGRSPLNSKPERTILQEGCSNVPIAGDSEGTTTDLLWFLKPCSYLE
ncbi:uncharacterized protein LOC122037832 [Zingiber officinale]|uniref:Uncharacterized protein n=1 Tax=Zingiber officinale TaxID=94328 RepID=A0A8J5EKD6_ZINOF|nr:uncharacterized protein LOC122037832 [Zingiber officinale]KAG6466035.1 hypothetical protein ZIOFF_076159 [Zingiber officinale]